MAAFLVAEMTAGRISSGEASHQVAYCEGNFCNSGSFFRSVWSKVQVTRIVSPDVTAIGVFRTVAD
jgi:hypothetical protein